MMNRIILMMTLSGVAALTGCVPSVEQPEVRLEEARLASFGLRGGVIEVRLSVHNPNRFAVRARGLTYDLEVRDAGRDEWVAFTDGRLDGDLRVGGRDMTEVVLPVEFTYRGLGEAMRGLIERGSFDYRLSGVVELQAPVRRDIPYQHAGSYSQTGTDD